MYSLHPDVVLCPMGEERHGRIVPNRAPLDLTSEIAIGHEKTRLASVLKFSVGEPAQLETEVVTRGLIHAKVTKVRTSL